MTQADLKTLAGAALVLIFVLVASPQSIVAQSQGATEQRAEIYRLKERLEQLEQTVRELKGQIAAIEERLDSARSLVGTDYPTPSERAAKTETNAATIAPRQTDKEIGAPKKEQRTTRRLAYISPRWVIQLFRSHWAAKGGSSTQL